MPMPLMVELDRGIQLPAALMETGEPLTAAQIAAKKQLGETFAREINDAVNASSADPAALENAWAEAHARANWRYRLLYGDAAFNRASIGAGRDALAEP